MYVYCVKAVHSCSRQALARVGSGDPLEVLEKRSVPEARMEQNNVTMALLDGPQNQVFNFVCDIERMFV